MNWQELEQASLDDIVVWAEAQSWCRAMADCAQDAEWHSEGDVWTHTKLVCQQLPQLEEWSSLTLHERILLIFTALFHDAAKPLTSQVDPDTGRITSPKHAVRGEHAVRAVLRDLDCDLATREEIAQLVRYHGRPAFLLEKSEPTHEVIRLLRFRRLVRFSNAFLMLTKAPVFRGFHFYHAWRMRCLTAENAH